MRAWVVPCRYDPVVFACVRAILEHHPDDRVIVVDSCSPDTSYLNELYGCDTLTGNSNYMAGAYGMALRQFNADYWCFIHDGLVPLTNLDARLGELTTVQWFPSGGEGPDLLPYMRGEQERMGLTTRDWAGVFGAMWFATDEIARQVEKVGWFDAIQWTKADANATERTLGMVLAQLGFDPYDALAGCHLGRETVNTNPWVRKHYRERP
jgi:hypothetical protein